LRYKRQTNSYECSAVALHNALVWSGEPSSYTKKKEAYYEMLQLEDPGISITTFTKLMRQKIFPFKVVKIDTYVTISDIRKYVNENGAVILGVVHNGFNHIGLVVKANKKSFDIVNWYRTETISKIRIEDLKKQIRISVMYALKKS